MLKFVADLKNLGFLDKVYQCRLCWWTWLTLNYIFHDSFSYTDTCHNGPRNA